MRTLQYVLYGDGDTASRIDRALADPDWQVRGLGESLIVKTLAIVYPDAWIPVFNYAGPMGKKRMLQIPALDAVPIDETEFATRGARAFESNRRLREKTESLFPDDPWGQMMFLYWLRDREPAAGAAPIGLGGLADELLIDQAWLAEVVELLRDKRQVIFYGPPGTGKTYVARKLAEYIAQDPARVRLVQFHPSYSYEDFVEGYRPASSDGHVTFELTPGPLRRIVADAQESEADWCLVIDEINRGNIAKIFGELYYLLEYRDEEIDLQYGGRFTIPPNVYVIATMNTADRSIALLDAALRRRFHFVAFFPDQDPVRGLLHRWLSRHRPGMEWVAGLVDRANALLPDRHLQIGPSHFMTPRLDDDWLDKIWRHSVLPYIEEQFFDEPERVRAFELAALTHTPDLTKRRLRLMTDRRLIQLTEWRPTPLTLDPVELAELRACGAKLLIQPTSSGQYLVQSNSVIGSVAGPKLRVLIQPKFTIDRLFYLLGATEKLRGVPAGVELASRSDLTEGFARLFLDMLQRRFRRGLLQDYVRIEESLYGVRGRIRMDDQMSRRATMLLPVEVAYDDYTEDIPENRVIKAALRCLERYRPTSATVRARLATALGAMLVVSDVAFSRTSVPRFVFTRLNEPFRPVLELATMIIRNSALEFAAGQQAAAGLLFDMNTIFEDFVFVSLERRLRRWFTACDRLAHGAPVRLDEAGALLALPDIAWWRAGRCVFVADAKYKQTEQGRLEDLYQVMAYCTATDLPEGMLVYAVQGSGPMIHQIVRGGPRLRVESIDLEGSLESIERRFDALAGVARVEAETLPALAGYASAAM